jgi:hypothetical protein
MKYTIEIDEEKPHEAADKFLSEIVKNTINDPHYSPDYVVEMACKLMKVTK